MGMGCTFSTGRRVWEGEKNLGLFHLKWLILVQIQLYFNRIVRQFTATTTTVICIHVLLAAEGGGGVRSNQSNPPRYGPVFGLLKFIQNFCRTLKNYRIFQNKL